MSDCIYPLLFQPVFRDYIWGGRHLETEFGRALPAGIVAESWEISGHPSSPTRATNGKWRGHSLVDILSALGSDLVGSNSQGMLERGKFPLLVKLLDANRNLSVQVHPDDAYAGSNAQGELGKAEMWYVLHAEPGAELVYGLKSGVDRSTFAKAVSDGDVETQLYRLPIHRGDCINVPPGTVHALLAGAVVAEIQQNSDTTYRIYDWGRLGVDGQPRPLHIEHALNVIDWSIIEPQAVAPCLIADDGERRRELLVDDAKFQVEKVSLTTGAKFRGCCDGSTFEIWGCVDGEAHLGWGGSKRRTMLQAVQFVLLPAALGEFCYAAPMGATLLRAHVGRPDPCA